MSYLRVVAQCPATVTEKLAVALTSDDRLFLINKSSVVVQTGPGELFGFGLGQFEEKALGCSQCIMLVMCTGVRVAARAWFLCICQRVRAEGSRCGCGQASHAVEPIWSDHDGQARQIGRGPALQRLLGGRGAECCAPVLAVLLAGGSCNFGHFDALEAQVLDALQDFHARPCVCQDFVGLQVCW